MKAVCRIALACLCVMMVFMVSPVMGEECVFTGAQSNDWNDGENWDCNHPPTSTDTAEIPVNETCTLNGADGDALNVEVYGILQIPKGSQLTLHGEGAEEESVIDGRVRFVTGNSNDDPVLYFTGNHIITNSTILSGSDGIWGEVKGILAGDSGKTLHFAHAVPAANYMRGNLDIQIALDLYATVEATTGHTITLSTNPKTGNGGLVHARGGTVIVNVDVNAHVDFKTNASGCVQFNVEIGDLTGDFIVKGGNLEVNDVLCTTGFLLFCDGGTISVADGATATFSGSCP